MLYSCPDDGLSLVLVNPETVHHDLLQNLALELGHRWRCAGFPNLIITEEYSIITPCTVSVHGPPLPITHTQKGHELYIGTAFTSHLVRYNLVRYIRHTCLCVFTHTPDINTPYTIVTYNACLCLSHTHQT